jgi:hypothetical protein
VVSVSNLPGAVERRVRVLLVRQVLEEQAMILLGATGEYTAGRLHRYVAGRFMLLTARVAEPEWADAYGLAKLAAGVYRQTSAVLHGNRAFADLPEVLVQEWESTAEQVRAAVARVAGATLHADRGHPG